MSGSFSVEQNGFSYKCPSIVIVDGHALTRSCFARILRSEFQDFIIQEIETAQQLESIAGKQIGLVALNIDRCALAEDRVLHSLASLRRVLPDAPVMLLTQVDESAVSDAAISDITRFGVRGYVTGAASIDIALAALRLVIAGGVYFPRSVAGDGPSWSSSSCEDIVVAPDVDVSAQLPALSAVPAVAFTRRERDVLATLQRGLSNKIIASELNLSQNTVKVHLSRIMRKLKTTNRTEAALLAQRSLLNGNGQLNDNTRLSQGIGG